jgi:hypothetical protein
VKSHQRHGIVRRPFRCSSLASYHSLPFTLSFTTYSPGMLWYYVMSITVTGTSPALLVVACFSAICCSVGVLWYSVWGHRTYTLFGILSLAFIMLIIVTVMITIALVYFQLAVEDYRWWWRAFLSGAYVICHIMLTSQHHIWICLLISYDMVWYM